MPPKSPPPPKRRARGTGSLFRDARRGGWVFRVPAGRAAGKTKYREFRAATQEAAIELAKHARPPEPGVTLADWSERWLASLDVREQSRLTYTDYFRLRITPALGTTPVARITAFDIEEAARKWGTGVTGVGATTVSLTLAALSTCLQAAVRAGVIATNPARLARKPRAVKAAHDVFSPAEMRLILTACLKDRKLYPLAVCAATGCRIGEALALTPADYDPASGRLTIARTYNTRTHKVGPPKSKNGARVIDVPPAAAQALALAPDTTKYRTHCYRWKVLLKRLGARYRGIHQLRHSVASHAIAAGVPFPNVARDLGDTADTIVKTYLHPVEGRSVGAAMATLYGGESVARSAGKPKKPKGKPGK